MAPPSAAAWAGLTTGCHAGASHNGAPQGFNEGDGAGDTQPHRLGTKSRRSDQDPLFLSSGRVARLDRPDQGHKQVNDVDDIHQDADGYFSVLLSGKRPDGYEGGWWLLEPDTRKLMLRQCSTDWRRSGSRECWAR
jgi:hypothetical protein